MALPGIRMRYGVALAHAYSSRFNGVALQRYQPRTLVRRC
jgi:hypothetical protein